MSRYSISHAVMSPPGQWLSFMPFALCSPALSLNLPSLCHSCHPFMPCRIVSPPCFLTRAFSCVSTPGSHFPHQSLIHTLAKIHEPSARSTFEPFSFCLIQPASLTRLSVLPLKSCFRVLTQDSRFQIHSIIILQHKFVQRNAVAVPFLLLFKRENYEKVLLISKLMKVKH